MGLGSWLAMRGQRRRWCLLAAVAAAHVMPCQSSQAQEAASAEVMITVDADRRARVEARFTRTGRPTNELWVLNRPCVSIENLVVERSGVVVAPLQVTQGPWLILRDTTRGTDSASWRVSYDVALAGAADIPLLHPAASLPREADGGGTALVRLRFAGDAGRVTFPHLTRDANGDWSATLVAVPSFVSVRSPAVAAAACDDPAASSSGDGGLSWRFWLLVGIMIAWVPIYQAWARRSEAGAT